MQTEDEESKERIDHKKENQVLERIFIFREKKVDNM